jgi:hypothetical protein
MTHKALSVGRAILGPTQEINQNLLLFGVNGSIAILEIKSKEFRTRIDPFSPKLAVLSSTRLRMGNFPESLLLRLG